MKSADEEKKEYRELELHSVNGYFGITVTNQSPAIVDHVKPGLLFRIIFAFAFDIAL